MGRCQRIRLREFTLCEKAGARALKGSPPPEIQGAEALLDCLGADPRRKIAKACGEDLSEKIQRLCVGPGVDLSDAFPGCDTDDPDALVACMNDSASRITCGLSALL